MGHLSLILLTLFERLSSKLIFFSIVLHSNRNIILTSCWNGKTHLEFSYFFWLKFQPYLYHMFGQYISFLFFDTQLRHIFANLNEQTLEIKVLTKPRNDLKRPKRSKKRPETTWNDLQQARNNQKRPKTTYNEQQTTWNDLQQARNGLKRPTTSKTQLTTIWTYLQRTKKRCETTNSKQILRLLYNMEQSFSIQHLVPIFWALFQRESWDFYGI